MKLSRDAVRWGLEAGKLAGKRNRFTRYPECQARDPVDNRRQWESDRERGAGSVAALLRVKALKHWNYLCVRYISFNATIHIYGVCVQQQVNDRIIVLCTCLPVCLPAVSFFPLYYLLLLLYFIFLLFCFWHVNNSHKIS